nr:hypothetical protein [Candidatus Sigynarchaeota archaeon]
MVQVKSDVLHDILVNAAFIAGLFWFLFHVYTIVTRYLYMFFLSWYPFLALVPVFFYPMFRRAASIERILLLALIALCITTIAGMVIDRIAAGTAAILADVALIAGFSSFLVLACSFFDLRALGSTKAREMPIHEVKINERSLLAGFLLVSASCFALGGTGADMGIISSVLLAVIAVSLWLARHRKVIGEMPRLQSLMIDARQMPLCDAFKAGLQLVRHASDALVLAAIASFLGSRIVPFLDPFNEVTWDVVTWRLILVLITSGLAAVVVLSLYGDPSREGDAGVPRSPFRLFSLIASFLLSIAGGIALFFASGVFASLFPGIDIVLVSMVSVTAIVPVLHGVQAVRGAVAPGFRGDAVPVQCAWLGVIAAAVIGAGTAALAVFVKSGYVVVADMIAMVALCFVAISDVVILVLFHPPRRGNPMTPPPSL